MIHTVLRLLLGILRDREGKAAPGLCGTRGWNTFENRKQAVLDGTFFSYDPSKVGVDDPASLNQIRVYPNPASGFVMIDVDGTVDVTLSNLIGQHVYQCRTKNGVVNISGLEPGIYLMQIDHLGKTYIHKLVVR